MNVASKLIPVARPRVPTAAVIVLHGGAGRRGKMAVSPTQLSVLRMIPVARTIARNGHGHLAVYRLLNSARGWDTQQTPVQDALWALTQVREELGPIPVALVGHSLGGRAALFAGQDASVTTVVALNPYLYPGDGDADLSGTAVLVVHGTADRVARFSITAEVVQRLQRKGPTVRLVEVEGGKHGMLRHRRKFARRTTEFLNRVLTPGREGSSP